MRTDHPSREALLRERKGTLAKLALAILIVMAAVLIVWSVQRRRVVLDGDTVVGAGSTIGASVFLNRSVPANSLVINEEARIVVLAGVKPNLWSVPQWALELGAGMLGKRNAVQRLCGSLQVDISKAKTLLGWRPPVSMQEGLKKAVSKV